MTFLVRAALLCAIALAELMVLQLRLDQRAILDSPRWWAKVLWYYPTLFQIALICAGSMAVLSRRHIAEVVRALRDEGTPSGALRFLGIHALLVAAFYRLSLAGLEGGLAASAGADLWFLSWAAGGLLALVFWGLALVRPGLWLDLLRRSGGRLVWGVALGCALWLTAQFATGQLFEFGRLPTLMAIAATLRATGHDAAFSVDPVRVTVDGFGVTMSAGCFGYEGIGLVLMFCTAYLVAVRKDLAFPRALILIPIAVGAAWGMNVLRVAALVLIGVYRGAYAIEGFHSVAGWLYFAAIAAGVVALSQRPWFAKNPGEVPSPEKRPNPAAPYLVPMLVLLATAMISRIFTREFDTLYPLRFLFVGAVLFLYRSQVKDLGWRGSAWAALPGALIFVGWMALEPASTQSSIAAGLATLPGWAAASWLAFRVVGSTLTVPLAEELAFRGYVIRKLTSADFEAVPDGQASMFALIMSSLMFGLMHGRFLAGTLAGVAFALTLARRGRLADAVVAHGTANALIAFYALTTQNWSVWE